MELHRVTVAEHGYCDCPAQVDLEPVVGSVVVKIAVPHHVIGGTADDMSPVPDPAEPSSVLVGYAGVRGLDSGKRCALAERLSRGGVRRRCGTASRNGEDSCRYNDYCG